MSDGLDRVGLTGVKGVVDDLPALFGIVLRLLRWRGRVGGSGGSLAESFPGEGEKKKRDW